MLDYALLPKSNDKTKDGSQIEFAAKRYQLLYGPIH